MDLGLRGRRALVCASTSGLGAATAQALAAEGAQVVFCGRRGELAQELAAAHPGCVGLAADLSTPDGARALHAAAVDAVGPPDILVLNGPGPPPGRAAELEASDISAALETLLLVQQALVAACLPHLLEQKWGRIVAIGSSGVEAPIAGLALSNLGRAALGGYLKSLANEVAGRGVTVNLVLPGRIATDRATALDTARAERLGVSVDEVRRETENTIAAGRYGEPAQFGAVAAFLCGEPAGYVTGTAVRCDGGLVPTL